MNTVATSPELAAPKVSFSHTVRNRIAGMFASLAILIGAPVTGAFAAPADPLGGATQTMTSQVVAYVPVVLLAVVGIAVAIIGINILFKLIRKAVSAA